MNITTVTAPLKSIITSIKSSLARHLHAYNCRRRYNAHEAAWRKKGDTRDAFEKRVDECRFLELPDVIDNASDPHCRP